MFAFTGVGYSLFAERSGYALNFVVFCSGKVSDTGERAKSVRHFTRAESGGF